MGERLTKSPSATGHRAIDPATPFGQLRVEILRAQHDLERPPAAHEAHEMLNAASTGNDTECGFRLSENCRLRAAAHIARQHELAARATRPSICAMVTSRLALR